MNTFLYKEDNQMYFYELIEFQTDCKDNELMEKISWAPIGAGRMSTSFNTFKDEMERNGYSVVFVKNHGKNAPIPRYFDPDTQLVKGATGNY